MKVIVGLGNPGAEYATTRHNVGFMVIDRLVSDLDAAVKKKMFRALVGRGQIGDEKVVLAKPQTYMNLSGEAVGALLNWYKLAATDLIVIYDDLDLPLGKLRIRPKGGPGGHKGIQSIIRVLGTENFPRIRIGIGRPSWSGFEADYVLGRFASEEAEEIKEALDLAAKAVHCIVLEGVDRAMNIYNKERV